MKIKTLLTFLFLVTIIILGNSCKENTSEKNMVTKKKEITKIVSLSPALTELLFHLNVQDKLVGRTDACTIPKEAASIPIMGNFASPYVEKILKVNPDLIITNSLISKNQKTLFEQHNIEFILKQSSSLDDYITWLDILGEKLNIKEKTSLEIEKINSYLKKSQERSKLNKKVLFVLWDKPLMVAGVDTIANTAIQLANCENAIKDQSGYFRCSIEYLLKNKPDVIVWAVTHPYNNKIKPFSLFNNVKVYKNFDMDALLRCGPRFTQGVDNLYNFLRNE
jgi:iron complex transport system substrate-binding protein